MHTLEWGLNCKPSHEYCINPSRVFYLALICYIVPWKLSIWMEGNSAARSLVSCSRTEWRMSLCLLAISLMCCTGLKKKSLANATHFEYEYKLTTIVEFRQY